MKKREEKELLEKIKELTDRVTALEASSLEGFNLTARVNRLARSIKILQRETKKEVYNADKGRTCKENCETVQGTITEIQA